MRANTEVTQENHSNALAVQVVTGAQRYEELFKRVTNDASYFNRQLAQNRHANRQHFALENIKKVTERN